MKFKNLNKVETLENIFCEETFKMEVAKNKSLFTFVFFVQYFVVHKTILVDAQGAFRKSINPDGSIDTWGDPVYCYEYTWKGPFNDRFNESDQSTCGSLNQKGMPCYHPFVWTYGEFKFNQPLPEVVEQTCKTGDINGNQCNPTCMKNANTCCKMTYFIKGQKDIANATSFCCKSLDTDKGSSMKPGCYTEKDVDGYDVEVCFCDTDRCNLSNPFNVPIFLSFTSFFLILFLNDMFDLS